MAYQQLCPVCGGYTCGADVRANQFFGFLRFKYKELQSKSIRLENLQMFN